MANHRTHQSEASSTYSTHRMVRALAVGVGLVGAVGLLSVMSLEARSETPPKGFEGGAKEFKNPFANPNPEPFFDDDFGDEDFSADSGDFSGSKKAAPTNFKGIQVNPKGGNTGQDVPQPRVAGNRIEVGGDRANGIGTASNARSIPVDADSGGGGKELITDFNFPDADIMDIAKTMGKLTGKNFILDNNVKGRVTIISNAPITVGDAWRAFLTALDINGFALIPSGKYIRIARQRDARDKQVSTYVGENSPATDALITRIFALKYISAEEVARVFRSFTSGNSRIIPYEQTNSVIVTDTGANISKLAKMLDFLDVEGFDAGIEVIGVKYASAVEIARLIDTLLPGTDAGLRKSGQPRPAGSVGRGGSFSARRTKEGGIINNIIADERTNFLIIHANTKGVEQVQDLVRRLDKKSPTPIGGGKIHVVYLQFADAEEIAKTLNSFSQDASRRGQNMGGATSGGIGVNPTDTVLFEGQIKASADKATNSVVITASPTDYSTVQRVISKLDIPRDEVYVETIIMETAINRDLNYSSAIVSPSSQGTAGFQSGGDILEMLSSPTGSKGLVLPFFSGGSTNITLNGTSYTVPNVLGLVKLIQTSSRSNVLATPQILTLDNKEATFEANEKIPVPTAVAGAGGAVSTSVTKETIGLSINLKPQINKVSNYVKLDIKTKLEDITARELPTGVKDLAFATIERKTDTSVVVADGDTVVLGGLVRDKQTETVTKVPVLGDIPLLGWLFRGRQSAMQKTNMLIFLTPHIIRQYEKVRALLDRKLQERDTFIEKNAGGNDGLREHRDQMIRGLPDMKDILNYKPRRDFTLNGEDEELNGAEGTKIGSDGAAFTAPKADAPKAEPQTPEAKDQP